jgi:hypothetical protein
MKPIIIPIICVVAYIIGMFITKIAITVYDNYSSPADRVDDFDVVFMLIWPIVLPIMGAYVLFRKLYKIAENIGDRISAELRNRK